jgi:glycosyltransferase involved in cell wall biosynthesis
VNILLVNWQDPANPRAGGAEVHLHEVFRRLRSRGHQVTWLASGWKGAADAGDLDGIRILRTGSRYSFGAAAVAYHRRHLASHPFHLVVEALNKVPVYAPLWCRRPVVLLVHHLFGTTAFDEVSLPLAALTWLQERPLPRIYRRVPVQAISSSTAADLVRRGLDAARIEVIHPGVDLDFFRPPSSPRRASQPTFVYLGRLQRYKRLDLVLQAFAGLHRGLEAARLVVAGKGDQEPELRRLAGHLGIADAVHFAGYLSEEEKRDLFQQAWANLFVSPKEGWGMTNLEAAACATATIASDSPGLRESVRHGTTGILVPHADLGALIEAMRQLASSPGWVEELGRGARQFALGFSWETAAERTEAHLAGALRLPAGR